MLYKFTFSYFLETRLVNLMKDGVESQILLTNKAARIVYFFFQIYVMSKNKRPGPSEGPKILGGTKK